MELTMLNNMPFEGASKIPNRSYMDGFKDRPTPRPNIDVVREQRHSPRSREDVELALSAIWAMYDFIDGKGSKHATLSRHLDFATQLYMKYLEEDILNASSLKPARAVD
jgi:hypothetical protein